MLSWHLSKAATNFGEIKSFLPLFLDVSVATTFGGRQGRVPEPINFEKSERG